MTHVIVDPGICGFTTDIKVEAADMGEVNIAVDTKCTMIAKLVEGLEQPVDAFAVIGMTGNTPLLETARQGARIHAACPTIAGIVKAVEVEAQMALPRDASLRFVSE
ncbi:MAG TPA: hypothetical protein DCP91_11685 [Eggerthellaceae bacterium]|nr:hypothetical protein [Eggerthellaceae bacterium]